MAIETLLTADKYEQICDEFKKLVLEQDFFEADGTIEYARLAKQFAYVTSTNVRVILVNARKISEPAQDAYLKICEDDIDKLSVAFIVEDVGSLCQALRSRLDVIRINKLPNDELVEYVRERFDRTIDDFEMSIICGRLELYEPVVNNLEELRSFHSIVIQMLSGCITHSAPKLILDWSKHNDDLKRAILAVCESAVRSCPNSKYSVGILKFIETISSVPSVNAEIHWWRACLAV